MTCKTCGHDHEYVRQKLVGSLWNTVTTICGFNKSNYQTPPSKLLHKRVCDWVQEKLTAQGAKKRILLMLPRGHLKTSTITIGVATWMIIRDPETRGFILHKLPEEAKGFLGAVKNILTSEQFRHYFPDIIPGQDPRRAGLKWLDEEICVKRKRFHPNSTLETKGLRSTIEGAHPIWAIADDLVDREVSRSPALTARAVEFRRNIGQILEPSPDSFFMVVGTSWPGGFYEEIIDDPEYEKLILGCFQDERSAQIGLCDYGRPIWEERYSVEYLESLRREMGDYVFAHQYLNTFAPRTQGFSSEDFRYYEYDASTASIRFTRDDKHWVTLPLSDADAITMTVDLATGSGDDETAVVVAAAFMRREGVIVVLDLWHGKKDPEYQIGKIIELAKKWNVQKIGFESTLWPMMKPWWQRTCAETGFRKEVVELSHKLRAKADRIWQLQPWLSNHRLLVRRNHSDLIDQFVRYSATARKNKDDLIDALAYQLDLWEFILRRYRPLLTSDVGGSADFETPVDEDDDEQDDTTKRRPRRYTWNVYQRRSHGWSFR